MRWASSARDRSNPRRKGILFTSMSIATPVVRLLCRKRWSRRSSRSLPLLQGRFAQRDLVRSVVRDQPSEWSERRVAVVHAVSGTDADFQHDGRAQLRACEFLYARRVCGLRARGAWGLLVCVDRLAAIGRRTGWLVRAFAVAPD